MSDTASHQQNLTRVRALAFDVFGTVVDWRSSIIEACEAFGAAQGVTRDWAAFADDWRGLYQPCMQPIRSGQRRFVTLDVLHRENLDKLLTAYKIGDVSEPDRQTLARAWHALSPWPDSAAGLARLQRKYVLATLSNGNVALMVNLARHAGLRWDAILGAEIAQSYKPQAIVYERTAAMLGLRPDQCMMVAAHNNDLAAARRLGFRTAYVNRPTEHGPTQTTDLAPEQDWDIAATSMIDLAESLGA